MPQDTHRILVVDDDPKVRRMLRRFLEGEGFAVGEAEDEAGVMDALNDGVDLITLDLNLVGTDGLTIARAIRGRSAVPIVMITGKGDTIDRVVGLELGADDYIAKPFHLREVLARIRSVLRRSASNGLDAASQGQPTTTGWQFDGYTIDTARRCLKGPDGAGLDLTGAEFNLLVLLAENPHRVLSRDRIMDLLKGHDWAPNDRTIDNQIARLRKKIEPEPTGPRFIKTVRGEGYCFTPDSIGPLQGR